MIRIDKVTAYVDAVDLAGGGRSRVMVNSRTLAE
jgi:hypothetical protein